MTHQQFDRFHTPTPDILERELAPMNEKERAKVKDEAPRHTMNWLDILVMPLALGWVIPFALYFPVLSFLKFFSSTPFDADVRIYHDTNSLLFSSVVSVMVWIGRNWWEMNHGKRPRYWRELLQSGNQVEIEKHQLLSCTVVWSDERDYESGTALNAQWIIARSTTGKLLVIRNFYVRPVIGVDFRFVSPEEYIHPSADLSIAFAPRTNCKLGLRFSGARIPTESTRYVMSDSDSSYLANISNQDLFFPPKQYGIVDNNDTAWVEELLLKATKGTS